MSSSKYFNKEDVPKWNGTRDTWYEFTRKLKVFSSAIYCDANDSYSVWQHINGNAPGGYVVGAPALPMGGGRPPAERARDKRGAVAWALLSACVEEDKGLSDELAELDPGQVNTTVGGVAVPLDVGCRAYLLMQSYGQAPIDDERIRKIVKDFNEATMLDTVGHVEGSVEKFIRHIKGLLVPIPNGNPLKPNNDACACRVLEQIRDEGTDAMADEAQKELKAPDPSRTFRIAGAAAGNQRDLTSMVAHFGKTWDSKIIRGKINRRAPKGSRSDRTGLIVSESEAEAEAFTSFFPPVEGYDIEIEDVDNDNAFSVSEWNTMIEQAEAFSAGADPAQWAERSIDPRVLYDVLFNGAANISDNDKRAAMEMICRRCFGAGHDASQCASAEVDFRSAATVCAILTRMINGGNKPQRRNAMRSLRWKMPMPPGTTRGSPMHCLCPP